MKVVPLTLLTEQEPTFWLRNISPPDAAPVMFPYFCKGKLPVYLEYSGNEPAIGVVLLAPTEIFDETVVTDHININRIWFCEIDPVDLQTGTNYKVGDQG